MDEVLLEQELAFAHLQVVRGEQLLGDLQRLIFQLDRNSTEGTKAIESLTILEKAQEILLCNRNDISKLLLLLREGNPRH